MTVACRINSFMYLLMGLKHALHLVPSTLPRPPRANGLRWEFLVTGSLASRASTHWAAPVPEQK